MDNETKRLEIGYQGQTIFCYKDESGRYMGPLGWIGVAF